MQPVIYDADERYPGPSTYPPPEYVAGIPIQAELDAYPRMFTWGELKGIIHSGDLEQLMRNKGLQARYDEWMMGMKGKYGSTEKYLTQARLPWKTPTIAEPTYDPNANPKPDVNAQSRPSTHLTPSTDPDHLPSRKLPVQDTSHLATPGSGASTPTSAGFVSLASLKMVDGILRAPRGSTPRLVNGATQQAEAEVEEEEKEEEEEERPVYLRWEDGAGLDGEKFAVLPNDWPYNVPYGVRHYCVWSRVPIAHPELVDYDPEAWSRVEAEGLGGFTGVTPLRPLTTAARFNPGLPETTDSAGRAKFIGKLKKEESYSVDVEYGGTEMRKWAGKEYQSVGGEEVARMVRGLWDERGWECVWFVNPPRLQSVPGFSHFHVFARRKTPAEIDASEAA